MSIGQRDVHHNATLGGLKGLARRSGSKTARFVIDIYGKFHNGDAEFWCHNTMSEFNTAKIVGYVFYEIDHYTYIAEYPRGGQYYGPETDRFEAYDIARRQLDDRGQAVLPMNKELGIDKDYVLW